MRDSTPQGVTPGSPDSLEGRNSVCTCLNGASEESIGIYAKSRCQWSGCSIELVARTSNLWPFEAAGALGTAAAAKAPKGSGGLPKQSVSWKSHRGPAQGGLPKTPESTIGEEWSPSPLPSVPVSDQESPKGCG